jgi:hypothetical protein
MPASFAALWALIQNSPWISSVIGVVLLTYVMPWLSQKFPQLQGVWAFIGALLAKVFPPAPTSVSKTAASTPVTNPTIAALQHLLADAIQQPGRADLLEKVSAVAKEYQTPQPVEASTLKGASL